MLVCTLFKWKPAGQSLTSVRLVDQHYDSSGAEAKTWLSTDLTTLNH